MNDLIILSGQKGSGKSTCGSFLMKRYSYYQMSFSSRLKDILAWVYDLPRPRLDGLTEEDRAWREQPHPNLKGGWIFDSTTGGFIEKHHSKWIDKGFDVLNKVYGIEKPTSFSTSYPFLYDHSYLKLLELLYKSLRVTVYQYSSMSPRQALQIIGTEVFRSIHPDTWCLALQVQIEQLRKQEPERKIVVTDGRFENEALWAKKQGALLIYLDRPTEATDAHSSEDTSRFRELADVVLVNEQGLDELENSLLALITSGKPLRNKQLVEV